MLCPNFFDSLLPKGEGETCGIVLDMTAFCFAGELLPLRVGLPVAEAFPLMMIPALFFGEFLII